MLRILTALLPLVIGAALATSGRAETVLDLRAGPPVRRVQGNLDTMANAGLQGLTVKAPSAAIAASDAFAAGRRDAVSRLPEPASWVIMLTGFGAVGLIARHRRAHRAA